MQIYATPIMVNFKVMSTVFKTFLKTLRRRVSSASRLKDIKVVIIQGAHYEINSL